MFNEHHLKKEDPEQIKKVDFTHISNSDQYITDSMVI